MGFFFAKIFGWQARFFSLFFCNSTCSLQPVPLKPRSIPGWKLGGWLGIGWRWVLFGIFEGGNEKTENN